MIIYSSKSLKENINIAIWVNRRITGMTDNVRDSHTLESTFSSCVYYDTDKLQVASIVCKLAQNQSFIDGNKRTALAMLDFYNDEYNLGLLEFNDNEISRIILEFANNHTTPDQASKILFG